MNTLELTSDLTPEESAAAARRLDLIRSIIEELKVAAVTQNKPWLAPGDEVFFTLLFKSEDELRTLRRHAGLHHEQVDRDC